jgi:hypothetical protein
VAINVCFMRYTECSIGHGVIKAPNCLLIAMRGVNTVHSCTRQVAEGQGWRSAAGSRSSVTGCKTAVLQRICVV